MKEGAVSYPIRIVAAQTGLSVETLRMWERRYGFPKPERRSGGGRLYREADIARLQLIVRARAAGYRPGDVVGVTDHELAALAPAPAPVTTPDVERLVATMRKDDLIGMRTSLRSLARLLGPRAFVKEVAHPLAVRIGEEWACGNVSVHQEHLSTQLLSTELRLLLSTLEDMSPWSSLPVVLLATLPNESHELGLEMVALYAATHRLASRLLGAGTPPREIVAAARVHEAHVIGISISTPTSSKQRARTTTELRALHRALRRLPRPPELWLGGAGAPAVAPRGRDVRIVVSFAELDEALRGLGPTARR